MAEPEVEPRFGPAPAARPVEIKDEPISIKAEPAEEPKAMPLETKPETPSEPKLETPATLPRPAIPTSHETPSRPLIFGIIVIAVLILSTLGAFLYLQNRSLQTQLTTIQTIESQRELSPTPTPTEVMAKEVTGGAFTDLPAILAIARQESPTAQLLMMTAEITIPADRSPGTADTASFQYWFRRGPGILEYFQVTKEPGKDPQIIKPAFISPDDNIPDLVEFYQAQTLGLDTFPANALAWDQLVADYAGTTEPIAVTAKYLRAVPSTPGVAPKPINLWQLTYKFDPASGLTDSVVQIDAVTQQVLFTNIPTPTAPAETGGSPS